MWFARPPGSSNAVEHAEPDPRARAERALLAAFEWMRCYHLGAGLVSLVVDRRRYRHPRLADAAFTAVAVESLWLFVRARRRGAYDDPRVVTVDTLTGCAGLVACALAVRPDDQFNAINWMFPLTLFSAVAGSAGFPRRAQSLTAGTALAATYALATGSQTEGSRRGALFGVWQYAGLPDRRRRSLAADPLRTRPPRRRRSGRQSSAGRVAEERERLPSSRGAARGGVADAHGAPRPMAQRP